MKADQIKQIALAVFSENGYEGASLSQIAKQVGLKTPSLYAHFESKEALFLSIYQDVVEKEMADIHHSLLLHDSETPREKIKKMFFFLTQFERRSVEKKFLQRFLFFPPVHLKNKLQKTFLNSEFLSSEMIMDILSEMNDFTCHEDQLYTFYCLLDGLLLEQSIYDEKEYRKRQQAVWRVFECSLRNGVSTE